MKDSIRTIILLLVSTLILHAQEQAINPEVDTIKWEYTNISNRVRSERVNISGHFITYAGRGFIWIQDGVDRTYSFDVKSREGRWPNADEDGELVYVATCRDAEGTIRISRRRRQLIVELDFVRPDKTTPHLVLNVNSYAKM